jgi:hypothetical protein
VRIGNAKGVAERALENERCDILADSVALVIALSSDSARKPERGEPLAFAVSAHVSAISGPLKQLAFGFGGALAFEGFSSLRFELRGTHTLAQDTTYAGSSLGASFGLTTFAARGCRLWRFGMIELAPCIGADVHHVSANATGFGGAEERQGEATSWGPAAGLFSRLQLAKAFAIFIAAEGVVPLTKRSFVYADVGVLYRASDITLQLLVAPEVRF